MLFNEVLFYSYEKRDFMKTHNSININDYNRIAIVGNNGSGKSYLAREIFAITGLPLIHLDLKFWRKNWEETPQEEWLKMQKDYVSGEKWIIDGNHTGTMELRFSSADLVIFMDINRAICLASVLRRYGKKREDMPGFLRDKLTYKFLKGLWSFPKNRKKTILDLHKKYPNTPFLIIKKRSEANSIILATRIAAQGTAAKTEKSN